MLREIRKILIANRGEIAVRVIRAAKELGIKTVAIYSQADVNSLHRYLADESCLLDGQEAKETYLNIDKILSVAKKFSVDAIHPGYGFLSQNPSFVRRVEEEGFLFIGPPARIHELAGNKVQARKVVKENGYPIVKGLLEPILDVETAVDEAGKIGYPVIIKPMLGGGGVGMKVCEDEEELRSSFNLLQKLSSSAFGHSEMYIEKYYPDARHIEVQILSPVKGKTIHLYERECSVQRRFQKVVEEAPSPALDEETREKLVETAVGIADCMGYVNAGTIEFIYVPSEGNFYFIELNSRIQVEHPVTEAVTLIDIVKEQIWIAETGYPSVSQEDVKIRGHAIEARIYAEDPTRGFMPAPGKITTFLPPAGPWVRVDTACYSGYEIPPFYDPMIAKLVVWGRDRREAINRLRRSLHEFVVTGVSTNIPLHLAILDDRDFQKGDYDTRFIVKKNILEKTKQYLKQPKFPVSVETGKEVEKERIPVANAWKLSSRILEAGL
ncbi:MAG: ATP-grasp domain-containing protein [Thermoproteales archaeon]|nr:ATP-grasp domain-containing protein [Thermoproteales archaeon]